MSLSKIVQESVSQIGEKIQDKYNTGDNWLYRLNKKEDAYYSCGSELSSFVKKELFSSQISLLEAELERKEKTRRDENFYLRDAVSIVEEDISYLQDQITKCKELMK